MMILQPVTEAAKPCKALTVSKPLAYSCLMGSRGVNIGTTIQGINGYDIATIFMDPLCLSLA